MSDNIIYKVIIAQLAVKVTNLKHDINQEGSTLNNQSK